MFLKSLIISTPTQVIREINFNKGLNLIVDETIYESANDVKQQTGNNVGKTTVLKLIDFCLGGNPKHIYTDEENKKSEYKLVKDFLIKKEILITLTLGYNPDDEIEDVIIKRNFLPRKGAIREINGEAILDKDFENSLSQLLLPELDIHEKPTFRQAISHNIRYNDFRLSNTLKTLDGYTSDVEYEALYLYLFGCKFRSKHSREEIIDKIKNETTYKKRLEKGYSRNEYEVLLQQELDKIEELNKQKSQLKINENFEIDLQKLNEVKQQINVLSSEISNQTLRRNIILESKEDLESQNTNIDTQALSSIYQQASALIPNLQKKFTDLVQYHNQMLTEKIKFITEDLPLIEKKIGEKNQTLELLLSEKYTLSEKITESDTFEMLESIIEDLSQSSEKKGEYENILKQISEVDTNLSEYNKQLKEIDEQLFAPDFEEIVKTQLEKFNRIFRAVSEELYGEAYAITYKIETNRKRQQYYKFSSFNLNHSSGKKQGEISCFDIAYTLFAQEEQISCLHFLLNDKKELMHDNQLINIKNIVEQNDIQFVASILQDKLPDELNDEKYFIVKLSQEDKLFRIENN